ncbi:MAG: hypothetical protein HDS46_04860 [Bacteroides sp.]|nr:hypothetical protein [Bacteroides sp.]
MKMLKKISIRSVSSADDARKELPSARQSVTLKPVTADERQTLRVSSYKYLLP